MANSKAKVAKAVYNFAVDGGSQTAITPAENATIPVGALIVGAWTNVTTNMTSGGAATVALAVGGVTIKGATAFNDAAYTGIDQHIAGSAAAETSSTGEITFTVATADLTAGVVEIYVEYFY